MRFTWTKFAVFILLIPCVGIGLKPGNDLSVYYRVAQYLIRGDVGRIYPDSAQLGNFFYGPLSFVFLYPLGFFSFEMAHWFWLGLEIFFYFLFWQSLARLFPELWGKGRWYLWALLWCFSIKPIHASFQSYNIQLMIAGILLWAVLGARSQSPSKQFLSGFFVFLTAGLKVFPLLMVVYLFIVGNTRVRAGLIFGFLASVGAPFILFGPAEAIELHRQFALHLLTYTDTYSLSTEVVNLSLPSLITKWAEPYFSAGAIGWFIRIFSAAILLIFFSWAFVRRPLQGIWAPALAFALMALLNVSSRPDYFVFYVPAFAAVLTSWKTSEEAGLFVPVATVVSFALMALISHWTLGPLNHQLEAIRIPVLGAILLCSACVVETAKS
jgi:hypothetical protein